MLRHVWLWADLLFFLCATLLVPRAREGESNISLASTTWGRPQGSRGAWRLAGAAVLLAQAPLLAALPFLLFSPHALLIGDAGSHARIGQDLATFGAPHGWIDTYDGGFPLGVSYPPLGWCVLAALIRLGVPTIAAIQCVGTLPYLVAPFLVLEIGRAAGARPAAAVLGSILMTWISPYNYWLGTEQAYLGIGLVSQSLAVICVRFAIWSIVCTTATWQPALAGSMMAATHPQIAAALCMALLVPVGFGSPPARRRIGLLFGAIMVAGITLYGPGLATLHVPFGWTPTSSEWRWWITGYRPDRLLLWFVDYELFDFGGSLPAVTSVLVLALLVLLARARRPRRGVIVAAAIREAKW